MPYNDGIFAYLLGMIGFFAIVGIAIYVAGSFFMMRLFAKAGVRDPWRAWVPVYNMMIFFKLGDLSPWLVLYCFGGAVVLSWIGIGAIFSVALLGLAAMAAYRIGLKLGKEPFWVAVFVVASIVWLGIVAFDKSTWRSGVPPAPWAGVRILDDQTDWGGVPSQPAGTSPTAAA